SSRRRSSRRCRCSAATRARRPSTWVSARPPCGGASSGYVVGQRNSDVVGASVAPRAAHGDGFDLEHQLGQCQRLYLDDAVRRVGRAEVTAAQLDYLVEMTHIGKENGHLDHILQTGTGSLQNCLQVLECGFGLQQKVVFTDNFPLTVQ